ncbi:hypothetical protein [Flavobacterium sp. I3-2]|uniref:hypothetical protein n=1 Tax=Flavobacterium sp. I3-2 TaxID=2748319 RepID=UPI0015B2195B|nr:hypothetical protein [Flavobacterium sp. I3-2]
MNYIEIKDCKKGYILKGESNHKVYYDENGKKIKGHFMVFLETRTDTDFVGAMITSVDYKGTNIAMNDAHFLTHFSEEPTKPCSITYKNSHLVPCLLIKVDEMGPFIKVGELSDSGIEFLEESIGNKGPYEWEEYLYHQKEGKL